MRYRAALSLGLLAFLAGESRLSAETGAITGTVDKPAMVTGVTAVDRSTDRSVGTKRIKAKPFVGEFDADTGRFTIKDLPAGATYDCVVDFKGGRLEGVNMKVPRSDYEEEQPLAAESVEIIRKKTRSMNKFEDVVEILAVRGNIQHAAVLINKLRTRAFYGSKPGEVIWRAELWRFECPEETWVKCSDASSNIVLYRERIQKSVYDRKSVTFDPALGGLQPTAKRPTVDLGRIKLPPAKPGVTIRSGNGDRRSPADAR